MKTEKQSHTAAPTINFNFGYIKQQAKPGSWRRGYGYLKESQVKKLDLTPFGVEAQVKGNFKAAYTVRLGFEPDKVTAECDCPLEEKWCKHAVVVGLASIRKHLYEQYFNLPLEDEHIAARLADEDFQGHYRFYLAPDENQGKPRHVRLRIEDRKRGQLVTQLEQVLREALKQQQGSDKFSPAEMRELAVLQLAFKHGQLTNPTQEKALSRMKKSKNKPAPKAKQGEWYYIPVQEAENLLKLLMQVEDLCDAKGNRLIFEEERTLFLLMAVNASMAGNVLVSLHWVQEQPYDVYPLEEIKLFGKDIPWGLYPEHNRIYPLANALTSLPNHLTRGTFTDIKDADGGKFMYEQLPHLRKVVDMDLADLVHQLDLKKRPPDKTVTVELMDEAMLKIRVTVDVSYQGQKVPYSKKPPETPYVMITDKKKDQIYWIKRDWQAEQGAYQRLLDSGLEPMQTNHFMGEGDNAIDFYNITLPALLSSENDAWKVKTQGDLTPLKASPDPLGIRADISFAQSVDQFILKIDCTVGDREMTLDEVQQHLMQGKKYFFLRGVGFVEIPLAQILQFGKTLQAFDAEEMEKDTYQIQTYKVGLLAELVEQGVQLKLSKKFRSFWEVISSFKSMEEVPIPTSVRADLRPYQVSGVNWLWFLYSYGLNGILADDMGLGKTLQTLVVMQHAKEVDGPRPSLIICPTSVVENWMAEIEKFTPDLSVINLTGTARHTEYKKIKDADCVITSYALLRRDIRALKEYEFRYVILDESQNIKNYESQTAQASKVLKSQHRLALSGTPVENRLSELWSVFDFLMPGFLYDIDDFRYRYIAPIEEKGNRDAERRLKKQVFPFLLRRLKQDVAKDLPPKLEYTHYCRLTDTQRELYLDVLEKTREQVFSKVADGGMKGATPSIFSALLRLRQICCHPSLMGEELSQGVTESGKFEALKEMLEDVIGNGHRVLLFSQFVEMLKLVRTWLDKKGIKYEYLTGESRDRFSTVERFNNDDSIPIFLMSLKAGGTGLNLTGADYVIHYDPWWNPAAEDQASDRAHRIGQTKTVFVYRMIAKGTVEEKIMKLQGKKRDLVDSIIAADRSVGKMLSFEDLKDILSADF